MFPHSRHADHFVGEVLRAVLALGPQTREFPLGLAQLLGSFRVHEPDLGHAVLAEWTSGLGAALPGAVDHRAAGDAGLHLLDEHGHAGVLGRGLRFHTGMVALCKEKVKTSAWVFTVKGMTLFSTFFKIAAISRAYF